MNKLILNKLTLKNFKGIKDFTFEPGGKDASIFGQNASGKTTLIDGFTFLLFGKDSKGKSDFQIKPVTDAGDEIHNLETEVEGVMIYNDKTITLKKRYYEKYTKKRGDAKKSFTGHGNDFWIDGVPAKKGEYASKIADIVDINAFKLVTNPMEFNELHWTERRDILIEMCGDVTNQDVIGSDKKLQTLSSILGDYSINDHKKIVQAKKKDINNELEHIPIRIAENQESVKDAAKPNMKDKTLLDKKLEGAQEELRSLQSNEGLSQKNIKLNEVNGKIQKIKNKADEKQAKDRKPLRIDIEKLEDELRVAVNQIDICDQDIKRDEGRNKVSSEAIDKVRERWFKEDENQPGDNDTCPACGQDLPEDQIESTIATFNKLKADRLEKINKEGKELKAGIEQREKDITAANEKIKGYGKVIEGINDTLADKKADLKALYTPLVDVDALDKEKDVLETEIKGLKNGSTVQEETAQRHIDEAREKINEWNHQNAEYKAAEKSRTRIIELEAQEKNLAKEFEKLEAELFLIEKFIVKKVEMLEGQINCKFKMAKFKLFKEQINGGIEECCETLYNGVPFNSALNNGAKINVGLDIISTLSEYYEFQAPVWLDNAESINKIISMDTQAISLFVSKDKKLTIK
jgi:DNA repair exonuclease SbcCD ATPase subunit